MSICKIAIRFSGQSIQWFRSYLFDRIFFVETENKLSDLGKISCGVPQSSILRPLQTVKSNLLLYADGSCLICQNKDIAKIEKILNEDFENICDWFTDNKLSIPFGDNKTKSIIFASKRRAKKTRKLNIRYK